jgi:hypothetical protein
LPGLSSFLPEKSNKMLRKNQYLLLPHVPSRESGNSNNTTSTAAAANNETSETSDLSGGAHNTQNHDFLMENHNNENHIAMINENDENYFEIFKTPMKFSTENNTEVTAQIGTTAHLPCTIHNVGEGVVSCSVLNVNCEMMRFAFWYFMKRASRHDNHFSHQTSTAPNNMKMHKKHEANFNI